MTTPIATDPTPGPATRYAEIFDAVDSAATILDRFGPDGDAPRMSQEAAVLVAVGELLTAQVMASMEIADRLDDIAAELRDLSDGRRRSLVARLLRR